MHVNKVKQVLAKLRPSSANPHVNSPMGLLEFRSFVETYIDWIGMAGYNGPKKVIPLRLIETENVQLQDWIPQSGTQGGRR